MTPTDLCYLGLVDVGQHIRTRQLSSVEVTRAILERISIHDGRLGSYATLTPELALHAAAEADREIGSGRRRGALHGVPIAVKDLCNTEGIVTAAGMAIYRDFVPQRNATVVSYSHPSTRGVPITGRAFLRAVQASPRRRACVMPRSAPTPSDRFAFLRL